MKFGHRDQQQKPKKRREGSDKYHIGEISTPIGPASVVIHLLDVSGFDTSNRHMIGVKQYDAATVWVRDTDEEVKRLMKDYRAMVGAERDRLQKYSEYLREQQHGKRR